MLQDVNWLTALDRRQFIRGARGSIALLAAGSAGVLVPGAAGARTESTEAGVSGNARPRRDIPTPKVKVFGVLPRRPGISRQEFHDHWRHPHGTMARQISIMRKYVQSHQIDCDLLGEDQRRYEGIVECWVDSVSDAKAFREEPVYVARILPDEPLFIDVSKMKGIITVEEVLQSKPQGDQLGAAGNEDWLDEDRSISIKLIQMVEADGAEPWQSASDLDLGYRIGAFRHVRSTPVGQV